MRSQPDKPDRIDRLRAEATASLSARNIPTPANSGRTDALVSLFELASAPETASHALALLHELQVHQVEVELQNEELCESRLALEASHDRFAQLYAHAPLAYLAVTQDRIILEANLGAGRLLGLSRAELLGRPLDRYVAPHSLGLLHAVLAGLNAARPTGLADLDLDADNGAFARVHFSAGLDPLGQGFLVALMGAPAERMAR